MPVSFGTLNKALSSSLAFEHKYVMFMKIKITVNFYSEWFFRETFFDVLSSVMRSLPQQVILDFYA